MKKRYLLLTFVILFLCMLTGCGCAHEWAEATCTTAKTCSKCGETEGEALGHQWESATCIAPETCTACGETKGEALGHQWESATCIAPETCTACGETKGEVLAHTFGEWQIVNETEMEHICETCGKTETVPADSATLMAEALKGTGWNGGSNSWNCMSFDTTNRFYMRANNNWYSGTWEMGEEQQTEQATGYHFYITDEDTGAIIHMLLVKPADEGIDPYIVGQLETGYVILEEYLMPSSVGVWEYIGTEWAQKTGEEVPPMVVIHADYSAELITDTTVYKGTAVECDESFVNRHTGGFNNRAYCIQTEGYRDVYLFLSSTGEHCVNIGNTSYRYILKE